MGECGEFTWMVQDERDDGRIVVSVDDESETFESQAEIPGIKAMRWRCSSPCPGETSPVMMPREARTCIRTGGG